MKQNTKLLIFSESRINFEELSCFNYLSTTYTLQGNAILKRIPKVVSTRKIAWKLKDQKMHSLHLKGTKELKRECPKMIWIKKTI